MEPETSQHSFKKAESSATAATETPEENIRILVDTQIIRKWLLMLKPARKL